MDGKSSKDSFMKASSKPMPKRNYSHREIVEKTDRFASVAKTGDQKKDMLEIKDNYYLDKEKANVNRFIRNRNFEMGKRAGLHQGRTREDLERQDKVQDQDKRNKTMKAAKTYYHKNYSLSKTFKEAAKKPKTKTRDVSKDKG